jgi:hypothetical protein
VLGKFLDCSHNLRSEAFYHELLGHHPSEEANDVTSWSILNTFICRLVSRGHYKLTDFSIHVIRGTLEGYDAVKYTDSRTRETADWIIHCFELIRQYAATSGSYDGRHASLSVWLHLGCGDRYEEEGIESYEINKFQRCAFDLRKSIESPDITSETKDPLKKALKILGRQVGILDNLA